MAMRVVLLTGDGPEHIHVARRLARSATGLDQIVVARRPSLPLVPRLRRAARRFGTFQVLTRAATKAVLRLSGEASRRTAELQSVLDGTDFPADVPRSRVTDVNAEATVVFLQSLEPDVLCIYGTSIVGDATLATAGTVALNMHTGISPEYRGADCVFWPIHNAEPEFLGATVHECTAAVDGGPIFGVRRARLEAEDGLGAAFARCVVAGAELFAETVDAIASGTAESMPQDLSRGTEYRAAMRDWRAELRAMRNIRAGVVRDHELDRDRPSV